MSYQESEYRVRRGRKVSWSEFWDPPISEMEELANENKKEQPERNSRKTISMGF